MPAGKIRLYAAAFLMEICYGLFLLVAQITATEVIGRPAILGLAGTLHVLMRVVGNVPFGRLSDRIGRKPLLIVGCAIFATGFAVLLAPSSAAILGAYLLTGVANALFWPLIESWIGQGEHQQGLLRFLGYFGAVFTIGIAAGSLLGGCLVNASAAVITAIGGIVSIGVVVLILWTEDAVRGPAVPVEHGAAAPELAAARRAFLLIGRIANFAAWVAIGITRFLFAKLCLAMGVPQAHVGYITFTLYAAWSLSFLGLIRFRNWTYRLGPLVAFQFLGAAAAALIWLRPSTTVFFAAFGLFGASTGIVYMSSFYYGQDGASDRGNKSGLHEMILAGGMLIGPLAGGFLAEVFDLRAPFLFAALVILGAVGIETIAARVSVIPPRPFPGAQPGRGRDGWR